MNWPGCSAELRLPSKRAAMLKRWFEASNQFCKEDFGLDICYDKNRRGLTFSAGFPSFDFITHFPVFTFVGL